MTASKIHHIGALQGDEEVIFHLRSISVAEENRYTARYAEISDLDSDEKKAEQEYGILTDVIASWSEQPPTIKLNGTEGKTEEGLTPADSVKAYFEERTPDKERIAQQIVLQYRRKLQPKVVFY